MPTLWEFVLAADNKHDLADPDTGRKWNRSGQSWELRILPPHVRATITGDAGPDWPDRFRQEWEEAIRAFRSVVARVKGARTRKPGITDEAANAVFRKYIERPRLRVEAFDYKDGRLGVARLSSDLGFVVRGDDIPDDFQYRVKSMLFQELFLSLVEIIVTPAPVCGRCGRDLKPTKTGRPSRRELCTSCQHALWVKKQSKKDMRSAWKRHQKSKRGRDGKNTKGGK